MNEIKLIEKNDIAILRTDVGRLGLELEKFKTRIAEDLRRIESDVRLELTLEKARIRYECKFIDNDSEEHTLQQLKIKEVRF